MINTEWWRAGVDSSVDNKEAAPVAVKQGSSVPFKALMLFTIILLAAPQQFFPFLGSLRIAMLSFMLAVAAHFSNQLLSNKPLIVFNQATMIILCLVAWAVATVPFSMWPGGSVAYLLEHFFKTVLVFLLLVNVVTTHTRLRSMLWLLTLISIPLSVTTLRNMASGVMVSGGNRVVGYIAPLTENPNDMALMLNLILPLAIGLFLVNRRFIRKTVLIGIIMLMVAGIIATFSRAGFLALATTIMCYAWLLRHRPQRIFVPVAFILMLASLPLVPDAYIDRVSTITEVESDTTGSSQARVRDTGAALRIAMRNPFIGAGIGMGTLAMNEERGATWTEIHNVYLMLAVELGMLGLVLFLMLLGHCFASTQAVMNKTRNNADYKELFGMAEAIKVSLIAFCVSAIFHPVAYHFYFYLIGGMAISLPTILANTNWLPSASSQRRKIRDYQT